MFAKLLNSLIVFVSFDIYLLCGVYTLNNLQLNYYYWTKQIIFTVNP